MERGPLRLEATCEGMHAFHKAIVMNTDDGTEPLSTCDPATLCST